MAARRLRTALGRTNARSTWAAPGKTASCFGSAAASNNLCVSASVVCSSASPASTRTGQPTSARRSIGRSSRRDTSSRQGSCTSSNCVAIGASGPALRRTRLATASSIVGNTASSTIASRSSGPASRAAAPPSEAPMTATGSSGLRERANSTAAAASCRSRWPTVIISPVLSPWPRRSTSNVE